MVINNDPNYEKRKAAEEKLNRSEEEVKEELIGELRKESTGILCLALMYAKNFEETGEDLTQRLITVEQNANLLEAMYKKGVDDTIRRLGNGKEGKKK